MSDEPLYYALFLRGRRIERNFPTEQEAAEYVYNTPTIEVGTRWEVARPYFNQDGSEANMFRTARFGTK